MKWQACLCEDERSAHSGLKLALEVATWELGKYHCAVRAELVGALGAGCFEEVLEVVFLHEVLVC